jgi:myo-inositol-1(or 4)-monophosphatase
VGDVDGAGTVARTGDDGVHRLQRRAEVRDQTRPAGGRAVGSGCRSVCPLAPLAAFILALGSTLAIPLFATNVALVEDGQIVASAVANGDTGELCIAESGRGAWLIESTGLRRLYVAEGYGLISVDPDNRGGEGIEDFPTAFAIEALAGRSWNVRALSSTIALVYVTSGRLAGAVYAPLGAALHFAAGALLAREAGAIVMDHTGADWTVDSPILVAAATLDLHAELRTVAGQVDARVSA